MGSLEGKLYVSTPDINKIQCKDCIYADKEKMILKSGFVIADKRGFCKCEKFENKPSGILFPLRKTGKYIVCIEYKKENA